MPSERAEFDRENTRSGASMAELVTSVLATIVIGVIFGVHWHIGAAVLMVGIWGAYYQIRGVPDV